MSAKDVLAAARISRLSAVVAAAAVALALTISGAAAPLAGNLGPYSATVSATTQAAPTPIDTEPPTAPANLVASVRSTSEIDLTWTAATDNVGVTGYRVERCQGANCSDFAEIAQPTATSYSDSGLDPGTQYSYRVRASDEVSAPPPPPPPSAMFSGPFNCYGVQTLPSSCYSLQPSCNFSPTTSAALVAAIGNATGGQVICLNSSGAFVAGIVTADETSDVTIQPTPGQTPSLSISFTGADHWHILGVTIQGGMVIRGSTNITVDHSSWVPGTQGILLCNNTSCGSTGGPINANVLLDFNDFSRTLAIYTESRITFYGHQPSGTSGWTISHSLVAGTYNGQCSDGIDPVSGGGTGPIGLVIGPGNEFTDINQGDCTNGAHADPIAFQDCKACFVTGNYFHNNGSGSGGIFTWDSDGSTVSNNVFLTDISYGCVGVRGSSNWTFNHNYIGASCTQLIEANDGGHQTNIHVNNSDFTNGSLSETDSACCTNTSNLNSGNPAGQTNVNNISGTPIYQGGGGYYAWLITGGAGFQAGSDGKNMGITP